MTQTRPMSLITAELMDAAEELADTVKENAALQLKRADGIVPAISLIINRIPDDETISRDLEKAGQDLTMEIHLNQLKENEQRTKIHRLIQELGYWRQRDDR